MTIQLKLYNVLFWHCWLLPIIVSESLWNHTRTKDSHCTTELSENAYVMHHNTVIVSRWITELQWKLACTVWFRKLLHYLSTTAVVLGYQIYVSNRKYGTSYIGRVRWVTYSLVNTWHIITIHFHVLLHTRDRMYVFLKLTFQFNIMLLCTNQNSKYIVIPH